MTPEQYAEIMARLETLERVFWQIVKALTTQRDAIIMQLGAVEDGLGYNRSVKPRHDREK